MLWGKKEEKNYARRYAHEYHLLRELFQLVMVRGISFPFFKWVYNIKVEGKKNLPKRFLRHKNYIYAANHVSMFDPLWVYLALNRPMVFMAKKELFDPNNNLNWWIKRLGAFSVDRQKPEISTFKTVKEVFKTSWSLGIFPQGGIKDNRKIENIHRGFAVIAKNAQADIIPIAIVGFEGYTKKFKAQNVKVVIGKPISHELPYEEIIKQWSKQICDATGFKNCMIEAEEKIPV